MPRAGKLPTTAPKRDGKPDTEALQAKATELETAASKWASLQQSIGNRAIGNLVDASNRANTERPTPVGPGAQAAIDSQAQGGHPLDAGVQSNAEAALGGDLSGVRVHSDPNADRLSRSLGAQGLTQGRDVFLRSDRQPSSPEGGETLAHELTHVANGTTASGAVMREPAPPAPAPAGPVPTPYPNTADATGAAPPAGPDQAAAPPDKRYNLSFEVPKQFQTDAKTDTRDNRSEEEAIQDLYSFRQQLLDIIDVHKMGMHIPLRDNREDHWVVGFWADKFGGVDLPDTEIWETPRHTLYEARLLLDDIKTDNDAHRAAVATKWMVEQAAEGKWRGAFDPAADKLFMVANFLRVASEQTAECIKQLVAYKEGTEHGAEIGVTVCKVSIAVLSTAVGGEAFTMARAAGYGLTMSGLAAGGATVITSEAAEVGGQIGEMIYGDREWGDFDYERIAKVGAKAAVTGFVGAVVGGKMGELVAGSFARYAAPWLAEAGINLNSKGMQMLGSMGLNWITTAGSSPFTTASGVLMDKAMGDKTVKSWGEFFGLVMSDMKTGLELGTFLHAAGMAVHAANGTTNTQAGEGPTSNGIPEPIGPEGDAHVAPGTSNGVPEPIGPGTEPTQPAGPAFEPTQPQEGPSNGVPRPIGPEGDANVAPGTSNGVPEPIGPGTEPTQPAGPAYEPTQPQQAPSNGVPEPVGPGGDANVAPGTSNGVPEPIGPGTEPTQPAGPAYEPTQPQEQVPAPSNNASKPMTETAVEDANATQSEPSNRTQSERTNAEESRAESRSQNEEEIPEVEREGPPTEAEFDRPNTFTAWKAIYRTNDPFEASQMFNQARAAGRPAEVVQTSERMQAHWEAATGQKSPAPVAFVDNFGRVIVDGTRAGEFFVNGEVAVPQGPVQNPGERVPDYAEIAPEEPIPGDVPMERRPAEAQPEDRSYPSPRAGEDRGVSLEIGDPVAAARRYYAENVAGRGVRLISGRIAGGPFAGQRRVEWIWQNEYGGVGDPPAAWVDGRGFLVVDADVVTLADNPGQLPQGPVETP